MPNLSSLILRLTDRLRNWLWYRRYHGLMSPAEEAAIDRAKFIELDALDVSPFPDEDRRAELQDMRRDLLREIAWYAGQEAVLPPGSSAAAVNAEGLHHARRDLEAVEAELGIKRRRTL